MRLMTKNLEFLKVASGNRVLSLFGSIIDNLIYRIHDVETQLTAIGTGSRSNCRRPNACGGDGLETSIEFARATDPSKNASGSGWPPMVECSGSEVEPFPASFGASPVSQRMSGLIADRDLKKAFRLRLTALEGHATEFIVADLIGAANWNSRHAWRRSPQRL